MMKAQKLLNEILPILYSVKDDTSKLQKILEFLKEEIYSESEKSDEIPPVDVNEWLSVKQDETETESSAEEANSFYDEVGTKIDPESVPDICMSCKVHWIDDPGENLLCRIKRFDHRNDKDFRCDAYKKI